MLTPWHCANTSVANALVECAASVALFSTFAAVRISRTCSSGFATAAASFRACWATSATFCKFAKTIKTCRDKNIYIGMLDVWCVVLHYHSTHIRWRRTPLFVLKQKHSSLLFVWGWSLLAHVTLWRVTCSPLVRSSHWRHSPVSRQQEVTTLKYGKSTIYILQKKKHNLNMKTSIA